MCSAFWRFQIAVNSLVTQVQQWTEKKPLILPPAYTTHAAECVMYVFALSEIQKRKLKQRENQKKTNQSTKQKIIISYLVVSLSMQSFGHKHSTMKEKFMDLLLLLFQILPYHCYSF